MLVGTCFLFPCGRKYKDLIDNLPHLDFFQPILSSSSLLIEPICHLCNKVITLLSPQPWNCLEKQGLYLPPSQTCSHSSTAHKSLVVDMENNVKSISHFIVDNGRRIQFWNEEGCRELRLFQIQLSTSFFIPKLNPSSIINYEMRYTFKALLVISNYLPQPYPITIPHTP